MNKKEPAFKRKYFLWGVITLFLAFLGKVFSKAFLWLPSKGANFDYLRPPGASKDETLFLLKCIRCRACANVCEAGCIRFFTFLENPAYAGTPYLIPRIKACNLCMNCTQICPTGALSEIPDVKEEIYARVDMGKAFVLESACLSYNGRVCGVCRDACPLKDRAITLKPVAKPVVHEEYCIGCGRCEERCPQLPAAILVRREKTYA